MKEKSCWIVGAGEFCEYGFAPKRGELVIAADGGSTHLERLGLHPDLVVGDFDSLSTPPEHAEIVRLPAEKDDTDMLAAIRVGYARGYRLFRLYGGTGGRIDHTLANIQLLTYLSKRGARGVLIDKAYAFTAITASALFFARESAGVVSVFAQERDAIGVCLEGLKYPLSNATLTPDFPLGVSNEFLGVPARISVADGTLLVVYPHTAWEADV